jgi:8-oxo-dGTP pyrophosphatase MutT (NUDIX family)|tara:strand:- start:774 stop:1406 length:633 start_codon:yes stop_codon:yes gene_type:complete
MLTVPTIDFDRLTIEEISHCLRIQPDPTYDIPPEMLSKNSRQAAVLIPFLRFSESWHLLYIRRATFEGDRHSGQVAFAGGKRELEDSSLEITALREAEEEVGIKHSDVNILGRLNHHHTISEFQVTPYIGVTPWPYPLKLDAGEVAHAFTLPLNWLANSAHYRTEQRTHRDSKRPWPVVYYEEYEGELLWGATARITLSLIDVLKTSLTD